MTLPRRSRTNWTATFKHSDRFGNSPPSGISTPFRFKLQRLELLVGFLLPLIGASLLGAPRRAAPALAQLLEEDTSDQHVYDGATTFVACPLWVLLNSVPELEGLKPAPNQEELQGILGKVGADIDPLVQGFPNLIAREDIDQEKLDRRHLARLRLPPLTI